MRSSRFEPRDLGHAVFVSDHRRVNVGRNRTRAAPWASWVSIARWEAGSRNSLPSIWSISSKVLARLTQSKFVSAMLYEQRTNLLGAPLVVRAPRPTANDAGVDE